MPEPNARETIWAKARSFEEELPKDKRKRLGQYFTGARLGKLLAHLALAPDTRTVLDPMGGHGDLLDATAEAALDRGIRLERLDGIEIDEPTADFCRDRLDRIAASTPHQIIFGNAFDPKVLMQLPLRNYDLVITNPPYVRYQTQNGAGGQGTSSRTGLLAFIDESRSGTEKVVWTALSKGYSGLADLSVPAWLLAALLVRPGGRLALVVPATWRSRNYGDVIRYLLLRCFELEFIVEDTQPGWFSDALVRTHLIVAKRLPEQQIAEALALRTEWSRARWLHVSPEAASQGSLVGAAFDELCPEMACARWLSERAPRVPNGILVRDFALGEEWSSVCSRSARREWYRDLEHGDERALPLFSIPHRVPVVDIPEPVRQVLGYNLPDEALSTFEDTGIEVGQGLRTGCNAFFYVDACGAAGDKQVRVKASRAYSNREFVVPADVLRPVLRRQSELPHMQRGELPQGRVLDLKHWVLPEDRPAVAEAAGTYRACGEIAPSQMPGELAAYVRSAASLSIEDGSSGKPASELSAVRTNVRAFRPGTATPRFWYMLPDFTARHLPTAFVPRVIQGAPWVELNSEPPILIDANFSTFWTTDKAWSPTAIKALLNSAWCQLMMEAIGTPMGGGALKLEASHLRQMAIPKLTDDDRKQLGLEGVGLTEQSEQARQRIDTIILMALFKNRSVDDVGRLALAMTERAKTLRRMRLRIAA